MLMAGTDERVSVVWLLLAHRCTCHVLTGLCLQSEEVEALSAIYGDAWQTIDADSHIHAVRIDTPREPFILSVVLPDSYPATDPPLYELDARWQLRPQAPHITHTLDAMYTEQVRAVLSSNANSMFITGLTTSSPARLCCLGGYRGCKNTWRKSRDYQR